MAGRSLTGVILVAGRSLTGITLVAGRSLTDTGGVKAGP